uniref:Tyrosine-protein phosphatase domain-containing protein n=1 Tax=Parastrongyloides trichosuri TaxID=131310 RepID=A0A0N4Z6E3_PARTI
MEPLSCKKFMTNDSSYFEYFYHKKGDTNFTPFIFGKTILHDRDVIYVYTINYHVYFGEPCGIIIPFVEVNENFLEETIHESMIISDDKVDVYLSPNKEKLILNVEKHCKEKGIFHFYGKEGYQMRLLTMNFDRTFTDYMTINDTTCHFVIPRYSILEITFKLYNHPKLRNFKKKIFVTMHNNSQIFLKTIDYTNGTVYVKPTCNITYILGIGIYTKLVAVSFGNDIYELKSGLNQTSEQFFNRSIDKIVYLRSNPIGKLICYYDSNIVRHTVMQYFIKRLPQDIKESTFEKSYNENETEYDEKIQNKKESNDRVYKNKSSVTIVIIFIFILLLIILFIIIFKKEIKERILKKIHRQEEFGIHKFWKFIQKMPYEKICILLDDEKYSPMEPPYKEVIIDKDSNEKVKEIDLSMYDKSLIKSIISTIRYDVEAHTIFLNNQKRRYILSEAPTSRYMYNFWKMIFNQDVSTIIVIANKGKEDFEEYWEMQGNKNEYVNVTNIGVKNLEDVTIHSFKIMDNIRNSNELNIYHLNGWDEGEIPNMSHGIIDIYKSFDSGLENKTILIHSSSQPDSRAFIMLYFCVCIEILSSEKITNESNPWDVMEIIKGIREQIYGGSLTGREFCFLILSIIQYFVKNSYISNDMTFKLFQNNIQENIYYNGEELFVDSPIKNFLLFINSLDSKTVKSLIISFNQLETSKIPSSDLYSIFSKIKDVENIMKKEAIVKFNEKLKKLKKSISFPYSEYRDNNLLIRYPEYVCLDNGIISGLDETLKKDPFNNFMNGNIFKYFLKNGQERKIILCQAPLRKGNIRMIDMLYRNKVEGLIILCNKIDLEDDKWQEYFPTDEGEIIFYGSYFIKKVDKIKDDVIMIGKYMICKESNGQDNKHTFYLVQYKKWLEYGVPQDINDLVNLYKIIEKFFGKKLIAIQSSAGIGRAGCLALLIHLIDTIDADFSFNMKKALINLRKYRCMAIQYAEQYLVVLLALCYYYKNEIEKYDIDLFDRVTYEIGYGIFQEMNRRKFLS